MRQQKWKGGGGGGGGGKGEKAKFCFLRMPELCKLIFCIWSVLPENGFVGSFSSFQHDSDQKTAQQASKRVFFEISSGEWVNQFRNEILFLIETLWHCICQNDKESHFRITWSSNKTRSLGLGIASSSSLIKQAFAEEIRRMVTFCIRGKKKQCCYDIKTQFRSPCNIIIAVNSTNKC